MIIKDIAIKILSEDYLLNIDMLECIRRGSAKILFASEEAVFLSDTLSQIYMISAKNPEIAKELIFNISNDIKIIVAHEKFSYNMLMEKFDFKHKIICHNAVYTKKNPIKLNNCIAKIKLLTHEYKDIIIKNYSKIDSVENDYIENRLKEKAMLGAFINNDLCGFIGRHEEGSIGMLEVLPEYRGRGIASALQITATNYALSHNRYPYGQIAEGNLASVALQKKLGFELSNNKVYWLIN